MITSQNNYIGVGGERYWVRQIQANHVPGVVRYRGNACIEVSGDFGAELQPVLSWKRGVRIHAGEPVELWLEYQTSGSIRVEMTIRLCRQGTADDIVEAWKTDLSGTEPVYVDPGPYSGTLSLNLWAAGEGTLQVGTLHARPSLQKGLPQPPGSGSALKPAGFFVPGGARYCTRERQEIFSYLDNPGDQRPPLVVYFNDFDGREGFEEPSFLGDNQICSLLFSDPRLEGGMFYLGSPEYEQAVEDTIRKTLVRLNWSERHLIFLGSGMGAFGALYYAARFRPMAVVLGTPILSLGSVALSERTQHPGRMETMLDILRTFTGGVGEAQARQLDRRLWDRVDQADFSRTQIPVARMIQDDFDPGAYARLVRHLKRQGVRIYDKAFTGRHESSRGPVWNWLTLQLSQILAAEFHRYL